MSTQTISVTSGKGGVGKTNFSVNLAIALAQKEKRVLLMDADFGLANIDILFNIRPKYTIESLVGGEAKIKDILVHFNQPGLRSLKVICASSGIPEMTNMNSEQMKFIISQLASLQAHFDYLIIDTGAGISENILRFNTSVEKLFIVTTPEPSSLTDAYAMIKVMHSKYQRKKFGLIVNQADGRQATKICKTFRNVAENNYLPIEIELVGHVSSDHRVSESVNRMKPLLLNAPKADASNDYRRIARKISEVGFTEGVTEKNMWGKFFEWSKNHAK